MIVDALSLVARANLAGSVAIVAVALLRRSARSIFGAAAAYGLWGIPLVMALASLVPVPEGGPIAPIVLSAANGFPAVASLRSVSLWPASVIWALGVLVSATRLGAQQGVRFANALHGGGPSQVSWRNPRDPGRADRDIGPAVMGRERSSCHGPVTFEVRFISAPSRGRHPRPRSPAIWQARRDVVAKIAGVALIQCLCWFNVPPSCTLAAARWIPLRPGARLRRRGDRRSPRPAATLRRGPSEDAADCGDPAGRLRLARP